MEKLTDSQKGIIEAIANEFSKLNNVSEVRKGGLLNVGAIIELGNEQERAIREIDIANANMKKAVSKQMDEDFLKLKPDVEALGLNIRKAEGCFFRILIFDQYEHSDDCVKINYEFVSQTQNLPCSGWKDLTVSFHLQLYHGGAKANNIEELTSPSRDNIYGFNRKMLKLYDNLKNRKAREAGK